MSDGSANMWLALDQAARALKEVQDEYAEKCREADAASRLSTDALNRLNQAQKAFDQTVEQVRAQAHRGSDWNNGRREVVS